MRWSTHCLLACAIALLVIQDSPAQDPPEVPEPAPRITSSPQLEVSIRDALQSRYYEEAVTLIDEALAEADEADVLLYLKGRALTELSRYDEAIAAYTRIEEEFAEGPWVSRARFGRADIFVRARKYQAAGDVYRAEAERLLSRQRKDELAAIYLEFANLYYEGIPAEDPSQAPQRDFQQALTYYQEALKLGPTLPVRQSVEFRIARCQQELGNAGEAIASYQQFLKQHGPDEPESGEAAEIEVTAEARFRLGESQLAAGQTAAARKTWQDFRTAYADVDEELPGELVEFLAKAAYHLPRTFGIPAPATDVDLELGVTAARSFIENYPEHELAPRAELEIAQSFVVRNRTPQAVEQLQAVIGNPEYAESEVVPQARYLLGTALLLQKDYDAAIAAWREFLAEHPTDPKWAEVQRTIVDTEYSVAEEQRVAGNYDDARELWETFLNKYPLDGRSPQILFNFGRMQYTSASETHVDRIKEAVDAGESPQSVELNEECRGLFEGAIADWRRLVSKYPGTAESSHASYMIGVTLETRLRRLPEALEAYKQVAGDFQARAQERITALTTPQLEVATERKFRSDEQPRIKVASRNIETVTVKVYRIDMNDYFRKMHLAGGVETLDIALIDPDEQFEHEVADYEEFLRIEGDIEIPMDGPGVTAVTVSSEKLEATTMVVVSDLDVIVKASRNELFLFAQNMLTGQPAGGASVLVSNGSEIFAEEVTGEDGVLQLGHKTLESAEDLRVFAVLEGHAASTVNSLNGLDFAVGLTPRGYLYTDRPTYRAGQLVNIKAIVRRVDQDTFTFEAGEKFKLDVYDARSRLIHTQDVALNDFGTISDNLVLPEAAALGTYRVHLHQPAGNQSYESSFSVLEYRLEPVRLTADLEQTVCYRGETVEGTISLNYYYGAPLAEQEIRYQFGSDGWQTATTDEKGEVAVTFETQQYAESQSLALQVEYPDRGLTTSQTVYLSTRGFEIAVSTLRDVYIDGETFDATFKAADAAQEAVATPLKVEVFEETFVRGQRGERLVDTYDANTDEEAGEARQTLQFEEGGRYIIRATGEDRFGNTISGQSRVFISGEKDAVRLRILAEQHNFKVGDDAQVRLHWREAPALALVTYEGASILGYQLINLETGENEIDVPIDTSLAPNFNLSAAVMERNRFHSASSEFRVAQRLNVKLTANADELKPGDDLVVEIEVTDPQGRPVSAELSLALIQSNLLQRFDDVQGLVDAFFGAGVRVPSIRQSTSCTFSYAPSTRGISRYLLAEAERREILAREIEALVALINSAESEKSIEKKGFSDMVFDSRAEGEIDRVLGEIDPVLVEQFNALMKQRRFAEAETVAHQVNEMAPEHPAAIAMEVEARCADRDPANRGLGDSGADSRCRPDEAVEWAAVSPVPGERSGGAIVDESLMERYLSNAGESDGVAVPGLTGRGMSSAAANGPAASPMEGAPQSREAGTFSYNVPDGEEVDEEFARTLSLVIRQHQQVHGDDKAVLLLSDGDVPVDALFDSPQHFSDFIENANGNINGVDRFGNYFALNGRGEEELQRLAEDGLRLLPGMANAETAFWDPVVVTDDAGTASVTIKLPDRSTAWTLRSKGINEESLAGQTELEVVTRKDLFGELKLPLAFTEGDVANVLAEVHNSLEGEREITVTFSATIGEKATEFTRTLEVSGPGVSELSFPVEITDGESIRFDLAVATAEEDADTSSRSVAIHPYGLPVYATASGQSSQSTIAFLSFDEAIEAESPVLELLIGPGINRALLDAVLGGGYFPVERCAIPVSGIERSVSDVLGGVALLEMVGGSRDEGTPEAEALAGRIAAAIAQLVSSQREDGAWSWSGQPAAGEPDRYLTSRVVWALSSAREAGFAVEANTFNTAVQYLKTALAASPQTDRNGRAILLQGLAAAGAADFSVANQLHRERNGMSESGLLHTALVLIAMDRKEMAADLLRLVGDPPAEEPQPQRTHWMTDRGEITALHLLALQAVDPASVKIPELADALLGMRVGSRWSVEKANGPAVAALAEWFAKTEHVSEKYTLQVFVNDREVETLTIDPAVDGSRRIRVPAEMLAEDKPQRINFDMEGRGEFSYSAVLTGYVPAGKVTSTTKDWEVKRRYEPTARLHNGHPIPRGFGVVAFPYSAFTNPLTQVPVGKRGEVSLFPRRRNVSNRQDVEYPYLILTEPIPAGCTVLTESIEGDFERYEMNSGSITFYLGDKRDLGWIRYTLVGYVPGDYRVTPSVMRNFYDPQQMAVAAVGSMTVLDRGEESDDAYRWSPEELYHLGTWLFNEGDHAGAHELLSQLLVEWRLRDEAYKPAVTMLFRTSLAAESHGEIVRYFEIIKEKFPDVSVQFEEILQVAEAYREIGEYERSYLVYRSTVQGSFERESQVAGFLNGRGEFARSVEVMEDLLRDYPAEPYIAAATYGLAQEVYRKAPEAAADPKLVAAGLTRVNLIDGVIDMLDGFIATWPEDPAADQASFALANALLDLEQYEPAIARCDQYAERYPESRLIDSYWYITGYSEFALGRHEEALETCRRVADAKFPAGNDGPERDADNKWEAIYIMGQVYHSLGRPGDAIEEYERVGERFADAAEAIRFFTEKEIALDEVTTLHPEDDRQVELKFRNIPEVSIKVYRIDLMKFGLMQRNLDRITAINLAGIKPHFEETIELGDGRDYRDREQIVNLPLDEDGAYLVVCRGENLYSSGLVLVSPLELEVQEDAASGRVRVTVKDVAEDQYAGDVDVRVIGSSNEEFVSGETDLRGLFIADDVRGTSTVIARLDENRFAFYRGRQPLQSVDPNAASAEQEAASGEEEPQQVEWGIETELRRNLMESNSTFQRTNSDFYRQLLDNDREGLDASEAY